jgi:hypothetical protein
MKTKEQKTYILEICRIGYRTNTQEVKARNLEEAKAKALDMAESIDFNNEHHYEIQVN